MNDIIYFTNVYSFIEIIHKIAMNEYMLDYVRAISMMFTYAHMCRAV